MPKGQRCEFKHKIFGEYDVNTGYRCDGTTQCWVTDGELFETEGGTHYCQLHAPEGLVPDEDRSKLLTQLIRGWDQAIRTGIHGAFVMPGLRCGDIHLGSRIFSRPVRFDEATFLGDAVFAQATFSEGARFQNATFSGNAVFNNATFSTNTYFRDATFSGDAYFQDATFSGHVSFTNATFSKFAVFRLATFSKSAAFRLATFSEETDFDGATFSGFANFRKATFSGDVGFVNATLDGTATYNRALFLGHADFTLASFARHLTIDSTRFLGTLTLADNTFEFPANLAGCWLHRLEYRTHSGARLFFNNCHTVDIKNRAAIDAETGDPFDDQPPEGGWSSRHASGVLTFERQHCEHITFQNMNLSRANFRGADVSKARFISCRWSGPKGPRFPKVWGHPDKCPVKQEDGQELDLFKNVYEQLKNNLEDHRAFVQAGAMHYWEMNLRKRLLRVQGLRHPGRLLEWLLFTFYRWISDYGESYGKLGAVILLTFIPVTLLVGWFECSLGDPWGTFQSTVFSLIPSGFQKESAKELLTTSASKWVVLAEGVILLTLLPLFIMAVRRRFRR